MWNQYVIQIRKNHLWFCIEPTEKVLGIESLQEPIKLWSVLDLF